MPKQTFGKGDVIHDALAAPGFVDVVFPWSPTAAQPLACYFSQEVSLFHIRRVGSIGQLFSCRVNPASTRFDTDQLFDVAPPFPEFIQHPDVTVEKLMPEVRVWCQGKPVEEGRPHLSVIDAASRFERVFVITKTFGNLIFEVRHRVRTLDPIVELDGIAFTYAVPDPHEFKKEFTAELSFGCPFTIDYASTLGVQPEEVDARGSRRLFADLPLVWGQQWFAWGALFCSSHPNEIPRVQDRIKRGRNAYGIANWQGHYAPFGVVPTRGIAADDSDFNHFRRTVDAVSQRHGYFEPRSLGLAPYTGQTGGQDDFGAMKGYGVLASRRTYWFDVLLPEFSEPLRPIHYRQDDGDHIALRDHPDWWTWSQVTHHNRSASPDRLGMEAKPVASENRWTGKDEAHISSNRLHLLLRTTGSMAAAEMVRDEAISAIKQIRGREDQGTGSVRSIGRRLHQLVLAWTDVDVSKADTIRLDLVSRIHTEIENVWRNSAGVRFLESVDPERTVRILSKPYRDARKLVDPDTQELIPCWCVWEHALALMGIAATHATMKRWPSVFTDEIRRKCESLLLMAGETLLRHGIWIDALGQPHYAQDLAYRTGPDEGLPLPYETFAPTVNPTLVKGVDRSFHDWMIGPIRYLVETMGDHLSTKAINNGQRWLDHVDRWRDAQSRFRNYSREAEWEATC